MLAEELCAEVLKSVRSNAETYSGEPATSAVITVPVAFGSAQCEAMRRSATLAGIENHLLLQEPIAAALAHGIERPDDTAPWLVYDLGGHTFSVSVLYKRNGVLQVAGHAGDSQLGGRDIDWAIVQQLLIPALRSERRLVDIDSNNARWRSAVHTLMLHAEAAKIRLSSQERTDIIVDSLCDDDGGDPVEFEFELNREDLERLTVHWEGCLQIARVPLQILLTAKPEAQTRVSQPVERLHKAFASYASDDRDEVLHRIQGMQKIVPDLEVFLDVAKLRSGDDWESRLWHVIPEQDVFYLFWSRAARGSTWVEKEWRCALKARGQSFIDPVPLEPPDVAEPPEELKKKHFNDWVLAYGRSRGA